MVVEAVVGGGCHHRPLWTSASPFLTNTFSPHHHQHTIISTTKRLYATRGTLVRQSLLFLSIYLLSFPPSFLFLLFCHLLPHPYISCHLKYLPLSLSSPTHLSLNLSILFSAVLPYNPFLLFLSTFLPFLPVFNCLLT